MHKILVICQARQSGTAMSSPTSGLLYGGYFHPSYAANEFITIATTGNAQDIGGDAFRIFKSSLCWYI